MLFRDAVKTYLLDNYLVPLGYNLDTLLIANDTVMEGQKANQSAQMVGDIIAVEKGWAHNSDAR